MTEERRYAGLAVAELCERDKALAQAARLREALEQIGTAKIYRSRGDEFACAGCWAYAGQGSIPDHQNCVHEEDCPFVIVANALAEVPAVSLSAIAAPLNARVVRLADALREWYELAVHKHLSTNGHVLRTKQALGEEPADSLSAIRAEAGRERAVRELRALCGYQSEVRPGTGVVPESIVRLRADDIEREADSGGWPLAATKVPGMAKSGRDA